MAEKKLSSANATKQKTTKTTVVKPEVSKKQPTHLTVSVVGTDGKVVEEMALPDKLFAAKVNPQLMAQAVRVYRANQRQGTASTKTRGEVAGSTKKIYRQKGTGNARHGGKRAPIFVHGGIAHGPKPHEYGLNMPQKMRQAALFSALTVKLQAKEIAVMSGLEKLEPKTKRFAQALAQVSPRKKKLLLVVSDDAKKITRATRNIDQLTYLPARQLNTYMVLDNSLVLFMKDALKQLEKVFTKE